VATELAIGLGTDNESAARRRERLPALPTGNRDCRQTGNQADASDSL